MTRPKTYSTREVAEELGVTYRQLDYWVRRGWIPFEPASPGSGVPRRWTKRDIARARVIAEAIEDAALILDRVGIPLPGGWSRLTWERSA